MHTDFDTIIAGAGCAGLSLAYQLATRPSLAKHRVLLVDPVRKRDNDRTWSYWSEQPGPFGHIVANVWQRLSFFSPGHSEEYSLGNMAYYRIVGRDFYKYVWGALEKAENIVFLQAEVTEIMPGKPAVVLAGDKRYTARQVFDSRLDHEKIAGQARGHNLLWQHFLGWETETDFPAFDAGTVQMFDLRIPQENGVCFVYILPSSENRALVEYTVFSGQKWAKAEYVTRLSHYLDGYFGGRPYKVIEEEHGAIPMTDYPFHRRLGEGVFTIGTAGGACKPSTGYAFARIQRDSAAIVSALESGTLKKALTNRVNRFWWYDAMMLHIMAKRPERIRKLFAVLFRKNGVSKMLRFLDEQTDFTEELTIMASVPPWPFLSAGMKILGRTFGRNNSKHLNE